MQPHPARTKPIGALILILIGGFWGGVACDDAKPSAKPTQASSSAPQVAAAPLVLPPMPSARESVLRAGDSVSDPKALETTCGLPKGKPPHPLPKLAEPVVPPTDTKIVETEKAGKPGETPAPSEAQPPTSATPRPAAPPLSPDQMATNNACIKLALLFSTGQGVEVDHERAFTLRSHACGLGSLEACVLVGAALAFGDGTKANPIQALAVYSHACDGGVAEGCLRVGAAYQLGNGTPKNQALAYKAFKGACALGNPAACFNSAAMEEKGEGTPANAEHAQLHYGMACSGGFPSACFNLGLIYDIGKITTANPGWAAELYMRACDAGHPGGCGGYGALLYQGRGVAEDRTRGHEMMQEGCAKSSDWACRQLRKLVEKENPAPSASASPASSAP